MNPAEERAARGDEESFVRFDASASRHRSHRYPGRQKAVLVRYDDDEYSLIADAAALAGLTPTGFVASVALAVAEATGRSEKSGRGHPAGLTGTDRQAERPVEESARARRRNGHRQPGG